MGHRGPRGWFREGTAEFPRSGLVELGPLKSPSVVALGATPPWRSPGPAVLPEPCGEARAEPTSGAEVASRLRCHSPDMHGGLVPAQQPRPPPDTSLRGPGRPTSPSRHCGDVGAQRDKRRLSLW